MVLVPEILGLGHGPFPRGTHGLVGKIGQLDITIGMESEVHGTPRHCLPLAGPAAVASGAGCEC